MVQRRQSLGANSLAAGARGDAAGLRAGLSDPSDAGFDSGKARANLKKQTPKQFTPGQTTRAGVMLALGEPDAVSPDEGKLGYRSEKVCGFWFIGGQGGGVAGTFNKDRYLVAEFDAEGRLVKAERLATWAGSTPAKAVLTRPAGANSTAVSSAARQAAPLLEKPARWLPGVNGCEPRGAASMPGEAGRMLCMDTDLVFVSNGQFANAAPGLTLPYSAITSVRVDKYVFGRRLVVHGRGGDVHSFDVLGPKGRAPDKQAALAVAGFLQARLNH